MAGFITQQYHNIIGFRSVGQRSFAFTSSFKVIAY